MKKFLQQTFASFIGSLAGLFFFFALSAGGLFFFFMALLMSSNTPQVENQSVLVFNLNSQITDSTGDRPLATVLSEESPSVLTLRQITTAINRAAEDERITALFLDGSRGNINTGYGSLSEIKTALENFKNSGKKIISYNVSAGEKDYFLTSIADEVYLNPLGSLEMNGLSSSQLFFADALDRYGIGVQIIRVGQYKSAVEPFTRNDFSPESRLQTEELLTNLWDIYTDEISNPRSLTPSNINNIADNIGFLKAEEAEELALIDGLSYLDEVNDNLKVISNNENSESLPTIDIRKYVTITNNTNNQNVKDTIAILHIDGNIVDGMGRVGEVGGDRMAQEIEKIRDDDNIKGVIVRINSPGGSAIASERITRELELTAQEKPIVISMGDVAASGGYWIATAGEKIFANESTITGSIGVFGLLFNLEDIADSVGVNADVIKTNELADINNTFQAKTDQEIEIYQSNVDQIYNLFLEKVAQSRNLSIPEVDEIAQGRVWLGNIAQEIGLVDEIGGLDSAIEYLNTVLELNEQYKIQEFPQRRNWENELLTALENSQLNTNKINKAALANTIWNLNSELELIDIIEKPNRIYSILPFKMNIK
ncbi:signal peptide peptidase SppA [Cyanobacterium stanieri LEGE 03274]|uniref:Protease 4 n=1 Tax=Cyanobacterium stanieri LEGE 03274 TaxID=1828756 RepID=A0ABR9V6K1_9CHRO|nr:signal peptide peptidase SppA [Cyanobacterium stanieri]MBE9223513.1 signal peptide peptidase SppA [Cyanobacterium stanieri LEGE 03274]